MDDGNRIRIELSTNTYCFYVVVSLGILFFHHDDDNHYTTDIIS